MNAKLAATLVPTMVLTPLTRADPLTLLYSILPRLSGVPPRGRLQEGAGGAHCSHKQDGRQTFQRRSRALVLSTNVGTTVGTKLEYQAIDRHRAQECRSAVCVSVSAASAALSEDGDGLPVLFRPFLLVSRWYRGTT